jgi:hypothetical protein
MHLLARGPTQPLRAHQLCIPLGMTMIGFDQKVFTSGLTAILLTLTLSACGSGGSDGDGGLAAACGPVVDLTPASSVNGTLASNDCRVENLFPGSGDLTFVDQYRVTLPSRGKLTIRMNSIEFDTFLGLLPPPLPSAAIAMDDDGGGGTNSFISRYLDAGTYIILANSALVSPQIGSYIMSTTFTTVTPTSLTIGSPLPGRVERNDEISYEVPVVAGARYTVSITGLTDNATLRVLGGSGECADLSLNASPKDCTVTAAGTLLTIRVDGNGVIGTATDYVVMAVPAVVLSFPIMGTFGSIPLGIPTVGFVESRRESGYFTTDLTPGTHSVSIVGLTGAANLHLYSDETYSFELDCTLREQQNYCTLTTGITVYFSVSSGPLNRDGAGYIILVW